MTDGLSRAEQWAQQLRDAKRTHKEFERVAESALKEVSRVITSRPEFRSSVRRRLVAAVSPLGNCEFFAGRISPLEALELVNWLVETYTKPEPAPQGRRIHLRDEAHVELEEDTHTKSDDEDEAEDDDEDEAEDDDEDEAEDDDKDEAEGESERT